MIPEEFKNKIALPVNCECGVPGYVLVENVMQDGFTICKHCNKKVYQLNCPHCESGYSFPEKEVNPNLGTWKCLINTCNKINTFGEDAKNHEFRYYTKEEVPQEMTEAIIFQFFRWLRGKIFGKKD